MAGFYRRVISLVLLNFFFVFNLAIPLEAADVEETGEAGQVRCHCSCGMKICCCCQEKASAHGASPCYKRARCGDPGEDGIICNALNHSTVISGEAALPSRLSSPLRYGISGISVMECWPRSIEKPPRLYS